MISSLRQAFAVKKKSTETPMTGCAAHSILQLCVRTCLATISISQSDDLKVNHRRLHDYRSSDSPRATHPAAPPAADRRGVGVLVRADGAVPIAAIFGPAIVMLSQ